MRNIKSMALARLCSVESPSRLRKGFFIIVFIFIVFAVILNLIQCINIFVIIYGNTSVALSSLDSLIPVTSISGGNILLETGSSVSMEGVTAVLVRGGFGSFFVSGSSSLLFGLGLAGVWPFLASGGLFPLFFLICGIRYGYFYFLSKNAFLALFSVLAFLGLGSCCLLVWCLF